MDDPSDDWMLSEKFLVQHIPAGISSDYIISVGASKMDDKLADFSNFGSSVDIAAPGQEILSTVPSNHRAFNSYIYANEHDEQYWNVYYDFEDCSLENIEPKITATVGAVSITDNKSYKTGNKSLKWEFDVLEDYSIEPFLSIEVEAFAYNNNAQCYRSNINY